MLTPIVIGTSALILAFIILRLPLIFISTASVGLISARLTCFKAAACITISGLIRSNILITDSRFLISPIKLVTLGYFLFNSVTCDSFLLIL